jgi:hypothetical protein
MVAPKLLHAKTAELPTNGCGASHRDSHNGPTRRLENIELFSYELQNRRERNLFLGQNASWEAQIDQQDSDAEAIMIAAVLPRKGEIVRAESRKPNEFRPVIREGHELKTFCGGQQLAPWHRSGSVANTEVVRTMALHPRSQPFRCSEVSHNLS